MVGQGAFCEKIVWLFIYLLYSLEHIWQGWAYLRPDDGKKKKDLQEEIHQEGGVWTGQPRQRLLKQLVLGSECFSSRYCSLDDGLGLREYGGFCVKWKSWPLMGHIPGNPGQLERRVSLTKGNPGEEASSAVLCGTAARADISPDHRDCPASARARHPRFSSSHLQSNNRSSWASQERSLKTRCGCGRDCTAC